MSITVVLYRVIERGIFCGVRVEGVRERDAGVVGLCGVRECVYVRVSEYVREHTRERERE